MLRFGVASRLHAGLIALIVLILIGGGFSLLSTRSFQDGLERMSGAYVPTLIATSLLAQQSHSIVANAPSLVVAEDHFVRRSVADRIADQASALTELRERLGDLTLLADELSGIEQLHADLVANFHRLDEAVANRIDHSRRIQQISQRLLRLPTQLSAMAVEPPPPGSDRDALTDWVGNAQHVVGLMLSALRNEGRGDLGRPFDDLRLETEVRLDLLAREAGKLPTGAAQQAPPLLAEMRALGSGEHSLFASQKRLGASMAAVQQALYANRELAGRFVAAVSAVVRKVESRALETGQGLSGQAGRTVLVLLMVVGGCLAAGVLIVVYINRNVIRRLVLVRDRMLDHVDGRPGDGTEVRARPPVGGADEIADIGMALDFFLHEIARREADLRAAKDAAEQALAELRQTQDSLIQAEKMAALGQLVAGVAHEINTPLGNALTSASFLSDETSRLGRTARAGGLRRAQFEEYMAACTETCAIILGNIARAADLVHSFKQVAVDQTTGERRRFLLDAYLQEVVQSLKPTWRKAGHQVLVTCPPDIEIDASPGALSQVLSNLIINSVVHGYGEGQAGTMTVTATVPDARTIELVYADDGRGIPAANRDKVFDPFFTTRRGAGSTGLGLHIVFNLVTGKLGGSIELESDEGRGCLFRIRFPRTAPVESSPEGPAAAAQAAAVAARVA